MKFIATLFVLISITTTTLAQDNDSIETSITTALDAWHQAASNADFDAYFGLMTDSAIFVGTDATEIWDVEAFKNYSKPHFDKGRAWSFKAIDRNVYVEGLNPNIAWFDEHLETQMGICRGSGVLKKVNGNWKVHHYVLSIAVPNENVSELTKMKSEWDTRYIEKMRKKQ